MCGIAGAFCKNGISVSALRQATAALSHRGPDTVGYYSDPSGKLTLGHRRLSILDLSQLANQPMHSACGRYIMVYNGEVYNFKQLKAKLAGFLWKTQSDSEVIIELFAAFGTKVFTWLNGMFSLAIYDTESGKLLLARDHIGIKPLFYYQDENCLVFASELKAVKAYLHKENLPLAINREAVPAFLHVGFIPEPSTIYQNVYKFPAAHYGVLTDDSPDLKFSLYWDAGQHFLTNIIRSEEIALKQYKELLFNAVGDQMVSDVPLGTFLSGGIDSSLITAVAAQISPNKISTFSIGFDEAGYDESAYAAKVAGHLKTEHHPFRVSVNDVLELVPDLLDVYDEPFADSSAFPTMLISKLAHQQVTVALSGDGGDELFQGYGMYTWAKRLQNPWIKAARKPLFHASQLMNVRYKRAGALFNYPSQDRIYTHIFSQEQYYFNEEELKGLLLNPSFDFTGVNTQSGTVHANPAERQAFWDLEHYLKDDLLVKVDRASMHYSLETRVPLLDIKMIEFALNLDYSLKVKKGYGSKYLMKKVLYELVPRELFERPKRGFAIPLKQWLKGSLACLSEDYLNVNMIRKHGLVHYEKVNELLLRFRSGQDHLYNRVWALIVLHWWMEKYT